MKNCSSCHGLNAEGGKQGPSLAGVGAAAVDFQVGTGRMPMAQPGSQAQRKPPVYNDDEVAAVAAYVAAQLRPCRRVERSERLVQQQQPRCDRERSGQRHPLRLAAGEFRRPRICAVPELHVFQQP